MREGREIPELAPHIDGREAPDDRVCSGDAVDHPSGGFGGEGGPIRQTPVQARSLADAQLDLGQVHPAARRSDRQCQSGGDRSDGHEAVA